MSVEFRVQVILSTKADYEGAEEIQDTIAEYPLGNSRHWRSNDILGCDLVDGDFPSMGSSDIDGSKMGHLVSRFACKCRSDYMSWTPYLAFTLLMHTMKYDKKEPNDHFIYRVMWA